MIECMHIQHSIPLLPIDDIDHLLPPFPPIQVHLQDLKRAIHVRFPKSADMRRDDAVRRVPERVVLGQGFRIGDVERRASESATAVAAVERVVVLVGFQGGDEVRLDDDLTAGDVGDEGVLILAEDGEFLRADEVGRFFRQGHADEQVVEVLGEEVAQRRLVEPAEPCFRDRAIGIPRPGHDEPGVVFGFRRRARRGRVCDNGHAQTASHAGDLPADATVPQHPEPLSRFIPQVLQFLVLRPLAPFVPQLPGVELGVGVGVGEGGQDDPLGDLGAVDAGRGGQRDGGLGVDGGVGDVVRAGGEEVDELEVGAGFRGGWQGREGREDGDVFVDFWR